MNKNSNRKKAFTLVETLIGVLIVVILVTMAVPMYERAVEKSRVAEVSMALKRIGESKLRVMDNRDITTFNNQFTFAQLDVQNPTNEQFSYDLKPGSFVNAVCAKRLRGDNAGTVFLFLGETASEYCSCPFSGSNTSPCAAYCASGRKMFCQNAIGTNSCANYGMDNYTIGSCGTP